MLRLLLALFLLSQPGAEGFYTGLFHFFTVPGELLVLLAFSLVISQHVTVAEQIWKAFALASLFGLAWAFGGWSAFNPDLPLLATAVVVGLYVASAVPLPLLILRIGSAVIGFLVGFVSLPDSGPRAAMAFTICGTIVGVNVFLAYVGGGLVALQKKVSWPWLPIGLRVAGSWVAAISVLLAALAFRAKA
jgi:urease accessory protein